MTDQQQQFQPTIAELGAKFGAQQAQAFSEMIALEKMIESQAEHIQDMTKNEMRLAEHIQDLERDLALLKSENSELEADAIEARNEKAAPS
jgi:septal ring factor EnvC (AmiA/AmiB activator)